MKRTMSEHMRIERDGCERRKVKGAWKLKNVMKANKNQTKPTE